MKLHLGRTKSRGFMTWLHHGYWYQGPDDTDYQYINYATPKSSTHRVRRMWGVSFGSRLFLGVMKFDKPDAG